MSPFGFASIPAVALGCYSILLAITWRHGLQQSANRYFAAYLVSMIVWSLGALMMYVDRNAALTWNRVYLAGSMGMPLFFYGFVRSLRESSGRSLWLYVGGACYAFLLVLTALGLMTENVHITDRDLVEFTLRPPITLFAVFYAIFIGLSVQELVLALRNTKRFVARNRARYVFVGLLIIVAGSLTNLLPAAGRYPLDIAANAINAFLIAYAIFRFHLLDMGIVVRKGLLYLLPTIIIGVGYLLIVLAGASLLHLAGVSQVIFSMIVAAVIAVALHPLRDWAQVWVDRLFFREKYDTGLMLQRLSRTAASVLDSRELAELILDEITRTMHVAQAFLFLREKQSGEYALVASEGSEFQIARRLRKDSPVAEWLASRGEVLTQHDIVVQPQFKALWAQERLELESGQIQLLVPLLVGQDLVGILALGPKLSEISYTPDEHLTLLTLANQTAVAVQNASLYRTTLEEKERAETILQQAFAGIIVLDQELRVMTMNPSAEKITGFGVQELRGQHIHEVLGPELWAEGRPLNKVIAHGQPAGPLETSLRGRGGSRDILLGMTPIRDGYLINFADITHLKEVDRLKSEIVANVSHELRTPLASIKGYTELLLEEAEGDDKELRRRFLLVIDEETDRLADFINELLDLARLESGHVELEMNRGSLATVLSDVARTLDIQAKKAGVTLHLDIPDDLPLVMINLELMHSAVKNLIANAIKFSPKGGSVEAWAGADGRNVRLEVVDHGMGIASDELPQLFTKFYRGAAGRKGGVRGTGLGLVLAKEVIALHHGTIAVASELGLGTRFTVTLPAAGLDAPRQVVFWGPITSEGEAHEREMQGLAR